MKTIICSFTLLLLIVLTGLLTPQASFAGIDIGNGGDGIILANGETVFYDLFERGFNADEVVNRLPAHPSFESELFEIENILDITHADRPHRAALAAILAHASRTSPAFVSAIIEELRTFHWSPAPSRLLPNPDTQPFIDLSHVTRIGCGRNLNGTILFSPECSRDKMSPGNLAAFILHEAIYSIYKRYNPTAIHSFDVRTLTAAFFDGKVNDLSSPHSLRAALKASNLKGFAEEEAAIQKLFFKNSYWYSLRLDCTFKNSPLKSAQLSFMGAQELEGSIKTKNSDDLEASICGNTRCYNPEVDDVRVWQTGLTKFDLKKKSMLISLGREFGDGESLSLQISFDGSGEIIAIGNGFEDEKPIQGRCR